MVKKISALCLVLAVIISIFAISSAAIDSLVSTSDEGVKFYDASQNLRIGAFGNSESIYAKVKFPKNEASEMKLVVAKYDKDGVLLAATSSVIAQGETECVTANVATEKTETIKVFVWETSLKPAILPGVIEKTGVSEDKFTKKDIILETGKSYALGELLEEKGGIVNPVDSESFKLETASSVTYTPDKSDWTKGTIVANEAGVISIKVYDNVLCTPFEAEFTAKALADKFAVKGTSFSLSYPSMVKAVKLGDIFTAVDGAVIGENVTVTFNGEAVAVNAENWADTEITFNAVGEAVFTITDNDFCKLATATVMVEEPATEDRFNTKFINNYTYRVGNKNTVAAGSIFALKEEAVVNSDDVTVSVNNVKGTVGASYTKNASDWTKSTIQFTGTGLVEVVISAKYTTPYSVSLEVIDATNATSAANATANDVVLLNNVGFSSIEVANGYTIYGNGFTMTCASDTPALDFGYNFVTLNNGILDNVQIICPNYDYAALYKGNLTSSENRSQTTDKTRYYNAKSAVMAMGNSRIQNSRIAGGRASLNVAGGNVVVDNSRIELGAVASVLVGSANSLTLNDTTLVQKPVASTYDPNKTLMGFSVLYLCDSAGNATPTTINGSFVQQAWIDESDSEYVPSDGKNIITTVLKETAYLHDIDGDGTNESLNLGFAYMPEEISASVSAPSNITDNRVDKETVPYAMKEVEVRLAIISTKVYVYSYKNSNGTVESFKNETAYVPEKNGDIITVSYADSKDGLEHSKSFGTDGWTYELNVDLDKVGGYAVDFSKVSMNINGVSYSDFMVNDAAKPASPIVVTAGGVAYKLTATVDGKEYTAYYKVTGTETSKESPSLVAANYEAGLCVASSYGGTWHGAAPVLQGIQIKYWSVAEKQYKTINLSDYTPANGGQQNGTNNTWTYSPANGDFTLTITGGQVHSSNNVYAMPVVCDGKLWFVASKSSGLVNSGNGARTIPVSYSFKDNNNGDELTFSHSWSVAENKDDQYKYSDFCSGTKTKLESSSGGGSCIAADTLITLADGTQKMVKDLAYGEELLVWNLKTGAYDKAPVVFNEYEAEADYETINLHFSDGSDVEVIYEHGFFDTELGEYVYITSENAKDYIGHTFVTLGSIDKNNWKTAKLEKVDIVTKKVIPYSPVTFEHLCYYTNGVLSMPGGIEGMFNIFEVDTAKMAYDAEKMAQDIEKYGLFEYADFEELIPEYAYQAFNGQYLKVAIGKGNITWEGIAALAERYGIHW